MVYSKIGNLRESSNIKVAHTAVPLQRYTVVHPKVTILSPVHMKNHKCHNCVWIVDIIDIMQFGVFTIAIVEESFRMELSLISIKGTVIRAVQESNCCYDGPGCLPPWEVWCTGYLLVLGRDFVDRFKSFSQDLSHWCQVKPQHN